MRRARRISKGWSGGYALETGFTDLVERIRTFVASLIPPLTRRDDIIPRSILTVPVREPSDASTVT